MTTKKTVTVISPEEYAATMVVARASGDHLLTELDFILLQPKRIVDVGCSAGQSAEKLAQRYPTADIFVIDPIESMLRYARQQERSKINWLCADESRIPLPDQSVDLIFANFLLPWCDDLKKIFSEWQRILKPEGLILFSSLGPDTLMELRPDLSHFMLPNLIDMHEVGDELIHARFADPVLTVSHMTVTYRDVKTLLHELQVTGMLVSHLPPVQLQPNSEGLFSLTYEVVYGHAWGTDVHSHAADEEGVVRIPLSHVRRKG